MYLSVILKGEPGLPGEPGMEGVPGPKVQIHICYMRTPETARLSHTYSLQLILYRGTEDSVEKWGLRESLESLYVGALSSFVEYFSCCFFFTNSNVS